LLFGVVPDILESLGAIDIFRVSLEAFQKKPKHLALELSIPYQVFWIGSFELVFPGISKVFGSALLEPVFLGCLGSVLLFQICLPFFLFFFPVFHGLCDLVSVFSSAVLHLVSGFI
jgi:hypothetical protein